MLLRSAEIKPAFIDLFSNENITYEILLMGRRMLLIEEKRGEFTDGVSYQFTDGEAYSPTNSLLMVRRIVLLIVY